MAEPDYGQGAGFYNNAVVIRDTTPASISGGSLVLFGGLSSQDAHFTGNAAINNVKITPNLNDIIYEQQAILTNNQNAATNIENFHFSSTVASSFKALVSVDVNDYSSKYALWEINGIYKSTGWDINSSFSGDITGVNFTMYNDANGIGRIRYTNSNTSGTTTIRFRATTNAQKGTTPFTNTAIITNTAGNFATNKLMYANSPNTIATTDITFTPNLLNIGASTKFVAPSDSNTVGSIITTGGNVGVGKTPAYKLDIVGDINFTGSILKNGSLYSGSSIWETGANGAIYTATEGNIGIATTAPAYNLDVNGTARATNGIFTSASIGNGVFSTGATIASAHITNANVTTGTVGTLVSSTASMTTGTVGTLVSSNANVTTGTVGTLVSSNASITTGTVGTLVSSNANMTTGTVGTLVSSNANMTTGTVGTLVSSSASIGTGVFSTGATIASAQITNSNVTTETVGTLISSNAHVTTGTVGTLVSSTATIGTGVFSTGATIASAQITNSNVTTETVGTLVSTNANITTGTVGTLVSSNANMTTGTVGTLMSSNASITTGTVGTLVSSSANIGTGVFSTGATIASAQISNANVTTGTVGTLVSSNANMTTGTVGTLVSSNANVTTGTVGTLVSTNQTSTNISAGTINISSGVTAASMNVTGYSIFNNARISSTTASDSASTGSLIIDGGVGIAGSVNIGQNLVINGNLDIKGTTTTVNTETTTLEDNLLVLNSGPAGLADGGLLVKRYTTGTSGSTSYAGLFYKEATDEYTFALTSSDPGANPVTISNYLPIRADYIGLNSTVDAVGLGSGGSLTVLGGAAISKKLFVGTDAVIGGALTAGSFAVTNLAATSITTSSIIATGNSNTVGAIITTGGNIGIGTTSPSNTLHVNGTSRFATQQHNHMTFEGDSDNFSINWRNTFSNTDTIVAQIRMDGFIGNDEQSGILSFRTANSGTLNTGMHIDKFGNVGINTVSPAQKLDVDGNLSVGLTRQIFIGNQTTGSASLNIRDLNTRLIEFQWSTATVGSINSFVGIQGLRLEGGGGASQLVLASTGNVGIGTSSPSNTLDVNGTARISTSLTTGALFTTNISSGTINLSTGVTAASAQITNANFTTITAGTILNTNAVSTNISSGTIVLSTGVTAASAQITNANFTTITAGTILNTNQISTNISSGTIVLSTGVTAASAQITNANFTTITAGTIVNSNASMTTATIGTILNTNAVSTNMSSGTLNLSTGITAASAQITNANITTQTIATLLSTNQNATNISAGTLNVSTGVTSASAQITNANVTTATIGTLISSSANLINAISTNISSGTLNLSTGVTSASAQITNANITTATIGTILNTNTISTNVSSGTLNLSTGVTSASAQITNANFTTITSGTVRVITSLLATGNSNTIGNIFTTGGNVGIGAVSPAQKLDIDGNLCLPVTRQIFIGNQTSGSASLNIRDRETRLIEFQWSTNTVGSINSFVGSPGLRLEGGGGASQLVLASTGNVGIGTSSPGYTLDVNGTIYTNTLLQSSDKRFKSNITKITGCLEKIKNIEGYVYDKKVSETEIKREIGFIAQELETEYPELVSTDANGYKSVAYANITAVLVEGIKDLEQKVKESDNKIVEQTVIISDLQERLKELALRLSMLESKSAF